MTIIVDLGCQDYGHEPSLRELVAEYQPSIIYGFDPSDLLDEDCTDIDGTPAVLKRQAAWLYDGQVNGDKSTTTFGVAHGGPLTVDCFDFSAWLTDLDQQIVLKMDIEGAEYQLLERMLEDGTDRYLEELLIEWHSQNPEIGAALEARLSCPIRQWWY